MTKQSWQKLKYVENEKSFESWNKKYFLLFYKGFQSSR